MLLEVKIALILGVDLGMTWGGRESGRWCIPSLVLGAGSQVCSASESLLICVEMVHALPYCILNKIYKFEKIRLPTSQYYFVV